MVKFSRSKVYLLDGAMGTEIQKRQLDESNFIYEGKRCDGFNDILCLTNPNVIEEIHKSYIDAGSDIIETNSFNSNYISAQDYNLENKVIDEINFAAAKIAKKAANSVSKEVLVAGVLGPTSKTLSMSARVDDPAHRETSYDELVDCYYAAANALLDGGALGRRRVEGAMLLRLGQHRCQVRRRADRFVDLSLRHVPPPHRRASARRAAARHPIATPRGPPPSTAAEAVVAAAAEATAAAGVVRRPSTRR